MNTLLTQPSEFAALIQRFFTERLLQQLLLFIVSASHVH
jgi:hypothetical protein